MCRGGYAHEGESGGKGQKKRRPSKEVQAGPWPKDRQRSGRGRGLMCGRQTPRMGGERGEKIFQVASVSQKKRFIGIFEKKEQGRTRERCLCLSKTSHRGGGWAELKGKSGRVECELSPLLSKKSPKEPEGKRRKNGKDFPSSG